MPYRAYRCQLCKENDSWFSVPPTEAGKKQIIKHFDEEHGIDITGEFND